MVILAITKKDLVNLVVEKTGRTKKDASFFYDEFVDAITECIEDGEDVTIRGLVKFEHRIREPRQGVMSANVSPDGKPYPYEVPRRKVIRAVPSKNFKPVDLD